MKKISRRNFLQQMTYASSAFGVMGLNVFPVPGMPGKLAMLPGTHKPEFKHPEIIRYDAQCFTIHNKDAFLYSACMHYPRTPKALWRDRLTKLKQAGFNTIETYVFWNYHEPVEGHVDMTAFTEFVQMVHELGLWAIIRVGPYVCAEWDAGGFPHWIIEKQFPLRSDSPESIRTSKDWYGHVLPIVRDNMITRGGPVILVQIENEYNYIDLPNENKLKYMTVLAETAWKAGIDVPLITNWCKQAQENSDPVMAQLMDTCDFYPRWNIVEEVVPQLAELRKQESMCPVGVAELQGGWFSKFGGELSVDQEGMNGTQLNLLTKTVMECGTTYLSFYMGHGGTNFDWAARTLTTTYDYAAPVREPGGLWEKYYAARRIGAFLDGNADLILRAQETVGGATSSNPHVSVALRTHDASGVLFVRENADADQRFHLQFQNPASSASDSFKVPRHGDLTIGPRGMKMLAVNLPFHKGTMRYCTAEILTQGVSGERGYVVIYDDPGALVEIAIQSLLKPQVSGNPEYVEFEADHQTVVIGFTMEAGRKSLLVEDTLQIIALPRELAGRTWTVELPAARMSDGATGAPVKSPVITDCALMRESSVSGNHTQVTLEYSAGSHEISLLTSKAPERCAVDGNPVQMENDRYLQTTTIHLETPTPDLRPVVITDGQFWVDRFSPSAGDWQRTEPIALEKLGQIPYGYVKYRGSFEHQGEESLLIDSFTDQQKEVFLNGKHMPVLSNSLKSSMGPLAGHAKSGKNLLEISYEAFGSANGRQEMQDLTGIRSIRVGNQNSAKEIGKVEVQTFPAAMHQREINPDYTAATWQHTSLVEGDVSSELFPAFTWFRAGFPLTRQPSWFLPRKLVFESSRDALLYLNGKFVGNYRTIGPQSEFYLPEPYLYQDGKKNIVTVLLAYTADPRAIRKLLIAPYEEFATRKTEVEFRW